MCTTLQYINIDKNTIGQDGVNILGCYRHFLKKQIC